MARLPDYISQTAAPGAGSFPAPRASYANPLASAGQQAGQAVAQLGVKMQDDQDRRVASNLQTKYLLDLDQYQRTFANRGDPQNFDAEQAQWSARWYEQNAQPLGASTKAYFNPTFERIAATAQVDARAAGRKREIDISKGQILQNNMAVGRSWGEGGNQRHKVLANAIDYINDRYMRGYLTDEGYQQTIALTRQEAGERYAEYLRTNDPELGAAWLDSDEAKSLLTEEERQRQTRNMQSTLETAANAAQKEVNEQLAWQAVEIEQSMRDAWDAGNPQGIDWATEIRNAGLSPSVTNRMLNLERTLSAADRNRTEAIGYMRGVLTGDIPFDPTNTENKDRAEIFWNDYSASAKFVNANDRDRMEQMVGFVNTTGYVPGSMKSSILGMLNDSRPERVASGAYVLDRLASVPQGQIILKRNFSEEEIAVGKKVAKEYRAGASMEEAVSRARDAVYPNNQQVYDLRRQEINDKKFSQNYMSDIEKEFGGFFVFDPTINNVANTNAAIYSNYQTLYEGHYTRTGDQQYAHDAAMDDLKSVWAVTDTDAGGKRVAYLPPELTYGEVDGSMDWFREQLVEVAGEDAYAVGDRETHDAYRAGEPVTYAIVVLRDGKAWQWMPGKRFLPDKMAAEARALTAPTPRAEIRQQQRRAGRAPQGGGTTADVPRITVGEQRRAQRELQEMSVGGTEFVPMDLLETSSPLNISNRGQIAAARRGQGSRNR